MTNGYLSQYFAGVAVKKLSSVEISPEDSHQHEFNGSRRLRTLLGEPVDIIRFDTTFVYFSSNDIEPLRDDGTLTWYDARRGARERGVNRREYRLYYNNNIVMDQAEQGDILILAKRQEGSLLVIIAKKETTVMNQLLWLFGLSDEQDPSFSIRMDLESERDRIVFSSRFILETIDIYIESTDDTYLEDMLSRFSGKYPSTKVFSEYARSTLDDIDPRCDHDIVIMTYLEREEVLFKTLEKHFVAKRLEQGFDDVDKFISYSLSVQNRRKSRAGYSLENHLVHIFDCNTIKYTKYGVTERKSKPDFIFPSIEKYKDREFNASLLTMLGVKTTCKERWSQILTKAERIDNKHLFTIEAAISSNQTDEMVHQNVTLVLPEPLHSSYSNNQLRNIINFSTFIEHVKRLQN